MNQPLYRVKIARVPSELKQFRRALIAHQGGHDYHGGDIRGILQAGEIKPGGGDIFGKGVYFARGKPAISYWENSSFRGLITPTENVQKQFGYVVKPESSSFPAFSLTPSSYRVQPRDLAVVGTGDRGILREVQKKLRVRPVSSLAYFGSLLAQDGEPVNKVLEELREPGFRSKLLAYLNP